MLSNPVPLNLSRPQTRYRNPNSLKITQWNAMDSLDIKRVGLSEGLNAKLTIGISVPYK